MIFGINNDISHKGKTYHVQTEDKGSKNPVLETLVYEKGQIVFSRKTNYGHLMRKYEDEEKLKKKLKEILESQHREVINEINEGKHDSILGVEDEEDVDDLLKKLESKALGKEEIENAAENMLKILEKETNKFTEKEFVFNVYFPEVSYDSSGNITIIGKIEYFKNKEPLKLYPIKMFILDKKQNKIKSIDTETNETGYYKEDLTISKKSRPYWLQIIVSDNKKGKTEANFYIK